LVIELLKRTASALIFIVLLNGLPIFAFNIQPIQATYVEFPNMAYYDLADVVSSLTVSGTVILSDQYNLEPNATTITFTNTSIPNLTAYARGSGNWDNAVKSLKVDGTVTLFEDLGYQGRKITFTSGNPSYDNTGTEWNANPNLTKSDAWDKRLWNWGIDLEPDTSHGDNNNYVNWTQDGLVVSNARCSGSGDPWKASNFDQGFERNEDEISNLGDYGWNDRAISLRVCGNVTLYENVGYGGSNITFGQDIDNLASWANRASSLKLDKGSCVTLYASPNFSDFFGHKTFISPTYQPPALRVSDKYTITLEGVVRDWYTDYNGATGWTGAKFDIFAAENRSDPNGNVLMLEMYFLRRGLNLAWPGGREWFRHIPFDKTYNYLVALDWFPEFVERTAYFDNSARWKIDVKAFIERACSNFINLHFDKLSIVKLSFTLEASNDIAGLLNDTATVGCSLNRLRLAYTAPNVTAHEGDLVIGGYETVLIENCTYIMQEGTIVVQDSAILTLRNVQLEFNESYKFPGAYLLVTNNAFLSVQNVTMDSNFGILVVINSAANANVDALTSLHNTALGIFLDNEATLSISNSTFPNLSLFGGSKASVSGSRVSGILLSFDRYSTVEVVDMQPGFYGYWRLWENSTISGVSRPSFELTIENSTIQSWDLEVDVAANVRVENSTVGLTFVMHETLQLSDMHVGYCANWSLNLIRLQGCFVNSVTYYVIDSVATISNCTGSWSGLVVQGSSQVVVQSSYINWIKLNGHVGSLTFDRVNFAPDFGCISFYNSTTLLTGDFDFNLMGDFNASYYIAAWSSTIITRNYNIITKTASGNPLENVELSLIDQNNTVVWNGHTDSLGYADFSLTFADSNYTDTLRLEAFKGNLSAITSISFLSDTPVIVTLGAHDLAATNIAPSKTVVGQGFTLPVNVSVVNEGDFAENFNVTGYANATSIGTQTVFDLSNGTSATLTFNWDTTGFAYGNYTVISYTWPVQGETNMANNNCTSGCVVVTVPGDIKGDFTVDIYDAIVLANAYNSVPTSSHWNSNADINGDNILDIYDAIILANHYNQHYP
jgi:hypothetical protein